MAARTLGQYRRPAAPLRSGQTRRIAAVCLSCPSRLCRLGKICRGRVADAEHHHRGTLRVHPAGVLAVLAGAHPAVSAAVPAQDLRRPLDRNPRRRAAEGVARRRPRRHPGAQPLPDVATRSRSPTHARSSAATCTRWRRGTCSSRAGSNCFMLRRIGAFSVYREGVDRQAIDTAVDILVDGKRPLVLFAEGAISRHNDQLMPMMDGVSFIARTAAKRREKMPGAGGRRHSPRGHPLLLPRRPRGDGHAGARRNRRPLLLVSAERQAAHPAAAADRPGAAVAQGDRVLRLGPHGRLLRARRQAHRGRAREARKALEHPPHERRRRRPREEPPRRHPARTARPRTRRRTSGDECRKQLAACYYVQQMSHYPRNYVRQSEKNIPEHILETVERFEEDFTDQRARPRPAARRGASGRGDPGRQPPRPRRRGRPGDGAAFARS